MKEYKKEETNQHSHVRRHRSWVEHEILGLSKGSVEVELGMNVIQNLFNKCLC